MSRHDKYHSADNESLSAPEGSRQRQFARLFWQCRRGMLELDLLLQGFLQRKFMDLDREQIRVLERVLEMPDQLLLDYLLGSTIPIDKEVADIVRQIRSTAHDPA